MPARACGTFLTSAWSAAAVGQQRSVETMLCTSVTQRVRSVAIGLRTHAGWHQAVTGPRDRGRRECQLSEVQWPYALREALSAALLTTSRRLELAVPTLTRHSLLRGRHLKADLRSAVASFDSHASAHGDSSRRGWTEMRSARPFTPDADCDPWPSSPHAEPFGVPGTERPRR
jgi:hypothetical protein